MQTYVRLAMLARFSELQVVGYMDFCAKFFRNLPSSVFEGSLDEVDGAIELLAAIKVGGTKGCTEDTASMRPIVPQALQIETDTRGLTSFVRPSREHQRVCVSWEAAPACVA